MVNRKKTSVSRRGAPSGKDPGKGSKCSSKSRLASPKGTENAQEKAAEVDKERLCAILRTTGNLYTFTKEFKETGHNNSPAQDHSGSHTRGSLLRMSTNPSEATDPGSDDKSSSE